LDSKSLFSEEAEKYFDDLMNEIDDNKFSKNIVNKVKEEMNKEEEKELEVMEEQK